MDRLANAVILSWGWRRRGIAFFSGAVSALAMPPFFIFPVLFIAILGPAAINAIETFSGP